VGGQAQQWDATGCGAVRIRLISTLYNRYDYRVCSVIAEMECVISLYSFCYFHCFRRQLASEVPLSRCENSFIFPPEFFRTVNKRLLCLALGQRVARLSLADASCPFLSSLHIYAAAAATFFLSVFLLTTEKYMYMIFLFSSAVTVEVRRIIIM